MYQHRHRVDTNDVGTAVLLARIIDARVERLVAAPSMSIHDEGLCARPDGAVSAGEERTAGQLQRGEWEVQEAEYTVLEPRPTPGSKPPSLASVHALSRYDQERLCPMIGRPCRLPTVALRAGLADLTEWLEGQGAHDQVEQASADLAAGGLTE